MSGALDLTGTRRTPYFQQSEASKCGFACLAMVASFNRCQTDLSALRALYSLSLQGATLKQVMKIAEEIGFNAAPARRDRRSAALTVVSGG